MTDVPPAEASLGADGSLTASNGVLNAKLARRKLQHDVELLSNRVERLREEERKAKQKVLETRLRGQEIAALQKRNEQAGTAKALAKRMELEPRLEHAFSKGIAEAYLSTDAWVTTGGNAEGVMALTGVSSCDLEPWVLACGAHRPTARVSACWQRALRHVSEPNQPVRIIGIAPLSGVRNKDRLLSDYHHEKIKEVSRLIEMVD